MVLRGSLGTGVISVADEIRERTALTEEDGPRSHPSRNAVGFHYCTLWVSALTADWALVGWQSALYRNARVAAIADAHVGEIMGILPGQCNLGWQSVSQSGPLEP